MIAAILPFLSSPLARDAIIAALVLAAILGAYFYVTGLQHDLTQAKANMATLSHANDDLTAAMRDYQAKVDQIAKSQQTQNAVIAKARNDLATAKASIKPATNSADAEMQVNGAFR